MCKNKFTKEKGLALILAMFSVLTIMIILSGFFKGQLSSISAQDTLISSQVSEDGLNFCIRQAFQELVQDNSFSVDGVDKKLSQLEKDETVDISAKVASNLENVSVMQSRFSAISDSSSDCNVKYIGEQTVSSSGGGGAGEITACREYQCSGITSTGGTSSSGSLRFYKVSAVNSQKGRVELQAIISL